MKAISLLFFLSLLIAPAVQGQTRSYGLPAGAVVIETQNVTADRALMLWMLRPKKNPRETPDEQYTCPEETRGSYYRGAASVSLVNTKTRKILNTLKLTLESTEDNRLDLPYQIRKGSYYHVAGVSEGQEGKPTLIFLKDYNGDGKALEFALFDALACMGLQTTLIGYGESQDKVIQYPIRLEVIDGKKRTIVIRRWTDYLFSEKPVSPGYWKFEIDYRGRGGSLDRYEIRYNRQAERFEGRVEYTGS